MTGNVTVVDYGSGNVLSVSRALEQAGSRVELTGDPARIAGAEQLFLPGVGAYAAARRLLEERRLIEPILRFTETGRPFLGICVGMQLMMDESEEFGRHPGFGLIAGTVSPIPTTGADGRPHPVPHIGWSPLKPGGGGWRGGLLDGIEADDAVYFVHSFAARPARPENVLATCDYDGREIVAAIARDNMVGFQFHPEKSGAVGLGILGRFVDGT